MIETTADKIIDDAVAALERRLTLDQMIDVLAKEAFIVRGSVRARLIADMCHVPPASQIDRIANLNSVHQFLEKTQIQPQEVIAWLKKRMR